MPMRVSIDSRTIEPGEYFIPIKGPRFDGRHYIQDAVAKGGILLDVDLETYAKSYRKKLTRTHVIGITGSAGKTTAKDLIASILSQRYRVVKTRENENNEIGVPLTILRADNDTDILVVEMGMRAKGEIGHLTRILRPTHTVITTIGKTHLSQFKSPSEIAHAKSEIFQKPLSWEDAPRYAFINYSTSYVDILKNRALASGYTLLPFSGEDRFEASMNMCYSIGRHFGLTDEEIQTGTQQYASSSHRMKRLLCGEITVIDDTYNANPDGVIYALQYLRRFKGRKLFVFGDMKELGKYSMKCHQEVVAQALDAEVSVIFTVGPETAVMQGVEDMPIYHFDSQEALQRLLIQELKPQDVVLVKGSRSMKLEETVASITRHFASHV